MSKITFKALPFTTGDKHTDGLKVSNFLVTLGTNKVITETQALQYVDGLNDMAQWVFADADRLAQITVWKTYVEGSGYTPTTALTWSDETVESTDVISKVEVGHMRHGCRLHLHVGLKIWHREGISLDPKRIKVLANEYLTANNFPFPIHYVHITVKGLSNEDYLRINQT